MLPAGHAVLVPKPLGQSPHEGPQCGSVGVTDLGGNLIGVLLGGAHEVGGPFDAEPLHECHR